MSGSEHPPDDSEAFRLGKLALERKLLTPEQLREALSEQGSRPPGGGAPSRSLGRILVDRGLLSGEQLASLLEVQTALKSPRSGDKAGSLPKAFGKYTLLRVVGRGGMGVVYEAKDGALERRVALKMMLPNPNAGVEENRQSLERFLREAKLSATLSKHPNLVSVYEAGVLEGRRYLAMEFIEGQSLARWRKSRAIPLREQIALLREVALGVSHAHRQGVIHRDLKPENILVDAQNQPHITDFGLAKMIGQNVSLSLTAAGMVMGTPAYMSPEQAQGLKSIDGRTDVYSLGVMLYELLTGRPPFTGETAIEILMKAARNPVARPTTVVKPEAAPDVDRAVENICLKALAKDPKDRYPTAEAFAQDLGRWIAGEPVTAQAPAPPKAARRPRRRAALWAGVGVVCAALSAGTAALVLRPPRDAALVRAREAFGRGDYVRARAAYEEVLDRDPANPEALSGRDASRAKTDLAESRRELERLQRREPGKGGVSDARDWTDAPPPDAAAWDHAQNLLALIDPQRDNVSGAWTRKGDLVVSDQRPRTRIEVPYRPPEEYDLRMAFTSHAGQGPIILLLPHAGRLFEWVMGGPGGVFGFETIRGASVLANNASAVKEPQGIETGKPHTTLVQVRRDGVRAFFDGKHLSTWKTNYSDLGLNLAYRLRDPGVLGLVTQGNSASFERIDLLEITGKGASVERGPKPLLKPAPVQESSLKPGLIAEYCAGTNFEVPLLRRIDPALQFRWGDGAPWPGGPCDWFSCRWSGYLKIPRIGEYTFQVTSDEGIRLCLDDVPLLANWVPHLETTNVLSVLMEPGFHKLSVEYFDETQAAVAVLSWTDPATGKPGPVAAEHLFHQPADFRPLSITPSPGQRMALGPQPTVVEGLAWSPDGRLLATASEDRTVRVWNTVTGKEMRVLRGHAGTVFSVAWSPDGKWIASGAYGGKIKIWDAAAGAESATLPGHADMATCLAWSPTSKLLASGGGDRLVRLWDLAGGKELRTLAGHAGPVTSVAWSRDSRTIASASNDGTVRLWNADSGRELYTLSGHSAGVTAVLFSPDGAFVLSGSADKTLRLWSTETGKEVRSFSGHTDQVRSVAWRPDGKFVASGSRDTTVRLWDVSTGQEVRTYLGHNGMILSTVFSPDGKALASSGVDAMVRLWQAAP